MIVYEVRLVVAPEIEAEYRAWLPGHIRELLALPGFLGAEWFTESGAGDAPCFVVQYRLVDAAALDRYLAEHAPRLRAEGIARFGDRFTASRRVLQRLEAFG